MSTDTFPRYAPTPPKDGGLFTLRALEELGGVLTDNDIEDLSVGLWRHQMVRDEFGDDQEVFVAWLRSLDPGRRRHEQRV